MSAATAAAATAAGGGVFSFSEQIGVVVDWFNTWTDCEKVVALYCLLRKLPPSQTKFLAQVLNQIVAGCSPVDLEEQANDPAFVSSLCESSVDLSRVVTVLLHCLPLLRIGNAPAKAAYLHVLPVVLRRCTDTHCYLADCQQILSYALIHPAISGDELTPLNAWQPQLPLHDDVCGAPLIADQPLCLEQARLGSEQARVCPEQARLASEQVLVNGLSPADHLSNGSGSGGGGQAHRDLSAARSLPVGLLHDSALRPSRATDAAAGAGRPLHIQHSSPPPGLPRALTPPRLIHGHRQVHRVTTLPVTHSNTQSTSSSLTSVLSVPDWVQRSVRFGADTRPSCQRLSVTDSLCHVPLSPQSSDASSGSTGADVDDASPSMHDVSSWLKSLRLHKYSQLFQQLTYDEMLNLTDHWLESKNVTKGARNKILINVQKLQERATLLRQLEKDVVSSTDTHAIISELRQILNTPIRAHESGVDEMSSADSDVTGRRSSESDCLSDADLPGLITRVLAKLCTELMVKLCPDNECLSNYLHLLDRCISHQAFTAEQRKKMLSWKQQIQRMLQLQVHRQHQHRAASSSASLPPCQPRSGTQRALRGQSPATAHQTTLQQQQQPMWTFIGADSQSSTLPAWQSALSQNTATAAAASLLWRPPPHVDQAAATAGKLPLGRTQSAPLRSNQTGLSVLDHPVGENDTAAAAAANEDLHASLNKLCISMIGAALDSGVNDPL